jgi:hypothetical protein
MSAGFIATTRSYTEASALDTLRRLALSLMLIAVACSNLIRLSTLVRSALGGMLIVTRLLAVSPRSQASALTSSISLFTLGGVCVRAWTGACVDNRRRGSLMPRLVVCGCGRAEGCTIVSAGVLRVLSQ